MEIRKTRHAVYQIAYHIVWSPKYRNAVFENRYEVALKRILAETCIHYGWVIEELNIMSDHVHLLVSAEPAISPGEIAKTLKSVSAVSLFYEFPDLKKKKFWGSGLWSSSTFYGTVGVTNEAVIRKYIQEQKLK